MGKPKYSFDPKCRELACYFMDDGIYTSAIDDLAQDIQDCVEAFFERASSPPAHKGDGNG